MNESNRSSPFQSRTLTIPMRELSAGDSLVAAIRKPLDALDGAAEEAANGMLGRAKLGLLVAANGLIAALDAIDAEFARQYDACLTARRSGPRPGRHPLETNHVEPAQ